MSVSIAAPSPETLTRSAPSRSAAAWASSSVSASRSARVVAARLDPRGERQLVEQLGDLRRGGVDHLDVPVGRRLEVAGPHQRPREAVHRRERRAQVVARERDEPGKSLSSATGLT